MSINNSLFTAESALVGFGHSMSVIGHNVANVNTPGYKASRAEFADLLASRDGQIETGHGVRLSAVARLFQQGGIQTTGPVTDLAIQGAGLFIVRDVVSGKNFYTRAGEFSIDQNGNLVNPQGLRLQGSGGDIVINPATTLAAQPTTTLDFAINLDASAATPATPFPVGPDASPSAWFSASNFSAVAAVFDSQGVEHDLIFLFRKSAANTWDYRVVANRKDVDAGAPNSTDLRLVSGGGTLSFTPQGAFDPAASTTSAIGPISWVQGAAQTLGAGSLSFAASSQFARPSALLSIQQDGRSAGSLTGITIDDQGNINGRFSNGGIQVLSQIQLADFRNVEGLDAVGSTLLAETAASGAPIIGSPSSGAFGALTSGALEVSTVDLAREFVGMITSQRSFQVNSRVITVADRMYDEAVNLKR